VALRAVQVATHKVLVALLVVPGPRWVEEDPEVSAAGAWVHPKDPADVVWVEVQEWLPAVEDSAAPGVEAVAVSWARRNERQDNSDKEEDPDRRGHDLKTAIHKMALGKTDHKAMGEAVAGRQVATSNSLTTHSLMVKVKEATVDKEGVTEEDMVVDLVTVVAPDNMTERVTRQHIRQEVIPTITARQEATAAAVQVAAADTAVSKATRTGAVVTVLPVDTVQQTRLDGSKKATALECFLLL
jgi:hypothetical protein